MKLEYPNVHGTIDIYMDCLRAICGDTSNKSMMDFCCAFAPNTSRLGFRWRRYYDIIDRKLDNPDEQQFFEQRNVLDMSVPKGITYMPVDVGICSDGIEHFYPEDGNKLIEIIKQNTVKQIIFTPLGEVIPLHRPTADDPEAHHSLWTPDDFPGWASIVFPHYHPTLNGGAFFVWRMDGAQERQEDFERVKSILETKEWAK